MNLEQLLALLPDNSQGDISASDMRAIVTDLFNRDVALGTATDTALAAATTAGEKANAAVPNTPEGRQALTVTPQMTGTFAHLVGGQLVIGGTPVGGSGEFARVMVFTGDEERVPVDFNLWWDVREGVVVPDDAPVNMLDGDEWKIVGGGAPVPAPPTITTSALNSMVVGTPFTQAIQATQSPTSFAATGLPAGISINTTTGVLTGTPTTAGSGSATVTATNASGSTPKVLPWTVAATLLAPNISTATLPALTQGVAMTPTFLTNTGGPVVSHTIPSGAGTVPAGMAVAVVSSQVRVTGTPTASGAYSFVVRATNSAGSSDKTFAGTIAEPTPPGSEISVFGSAPHPAAATLTSHSDGPTGSWMAEQFYITADPARNWFIKGMRIYVPTGSSLIGRSAFGGVKRRPAADGGPWSGIAGGANMEENGFKTAFPAALAAGWNEVRFADGSLPMNSGDGILVGYTIGGYYLHTATGMSVDAIQSASGANLYLAEISSGFSPVDRPFFCEVPTGSFDKTEALSYGIDILVGETA